MDPDPELGKFKAGSGSGINHFGSTTLFLSCKEIAHTLKIRPHLIIFIADANDKKVNHMASKKVMHCTEFLS